MSIRHHGEYEDTEPELYCSPNDDVARFIRPRRTSETPNDVFPDEFGPETTPTKDDVERHIQAASAEFERITQQAWRANQVRDETHDHKGLYYWLSGHPIDLQMREIRPLDPDKGDKLEVSTGSDWQDWLTEGSYEEGRDNDYWIDAPLGILWIYERAILRPHPKFRITYRYGYDHIPHDIRDAVAKRAAADIVTGDFGGTITPGNQQGENATPMSMAELWRDDFKEVARRYKKISFV